MCFFLDNGFKMGIMTLAKIDASVAKLVDATDSKSVDGNIMLVQVRPEVPNQAAPILGADFFMFSKRLCWFDKHPFRKC